MKTFLIAALTADGFIAKDSSHLADWTSKEDKEFFTKLTKKAGVVIMGLNTYRTIGKPLPGRLNVVYAPLTERITGVQITQKEPAALLKRFESHGQKEVAIIGGASIYTQFLQAGLIDELYLTIEPLLFGQGMNLLAQSLDVSLELNSVKKINKNTVILKYKVKK